ncbi:MAG: hypothetical protein ACLR8Y_09960 [Alistipes indistinctus]
MEFDLAMSVTPYFGLELARAESILAEVKRAVSGWRKLATKYGISKSEQDVVAVVAQILTVKQISFTQGHRIIYPIPYNGY